jgi:hypothetical protein
MVMIKEQQQQQQKLMMSVVQYITNKTKHVTLKHNHWKIYFYLLIYTSVCEIQI